MPAAPTGSMCHAAALKRWLLVRRQKRRRFWPRHRLLDGEAQTSIVRHRGQQCFDPLVVDLGARERAGETVSFADAFLGTWRNARACAVPRGSSSECRIKLTRPAMPSVASLAPSTRNSRFLARLSRALAAALN
jgi:hypothetical protein